MSTLEDWMTRCADALGVTDVWATSDRDPVLHMTRDVAHGVARPAAPLTAYLVGIAVGRGATPGEALAIVVALADGEVGGEVS